MSNHRVEPNAADPYRSPGARKPPVIIDHRHFSPIAPCVVFGILAAFTILTSHRVELGCERAADGSGFCESRDVHVAWSSGPVRHDLAGIKGAALDRGNKGASRVALITTQGRVPLTDTKESGSHEQLAMIKAIERFLATRTERRLEVSYGSPWADNLPFLILISPFWLLFMLLSRRVRVVVDRGARQVRILRSRFPLPPREEGFELAAVTRAEMETSSGTKGTTYRVALVLANGARAPLTEGYSSGPAAKQRTIDAINRALTEDA